MAPNTVSFRFETTNVHGGDTFSKADQYVTVSSRVFSDRQSQFEEVGRTEVIKNNRDANFHNLVDVPFYLERQQLLVRVMDWDSDSGKKDDVLAEFTLEMSDLVKMGTGSKSLSFGKDDRSTLKIFYEKGSSSNDRIHMKVKCNGLENKDGMFGKSDPYLVVMRKIGDTDDSWSVCYKTPVKKNNLNPVFEIDTTMSEFCNNNMYATLRVVLFDDDDHGQNIDKDDRLGECEIILDNLVRDRTTTMELYKVKDGKKTTKKGKYGKITFDEVAHSHFKSLTDYISEGLEITGFIAVDYTGSNGHPQDAGSLHATSTSHPNPYEEAIRGVAQAVVPYDSNHTLDVSGFGGVNSRSGSSDVSHLFDVEDNPPFNDPSLDANANGVERAVRAYRNSFKYVTLSGPTFLTPTLDAAISVAESMAEQRKYLLLVIITDDTPNDFDNIQQRFVKLSELPISVVIVGVGNRNFDRFDKLDDAGATDSRGFGVLDDKVQFVHYNKVRSASQRCISSHILEEFPGQVEKYFHRKGF